jgi:hypothetical protein
VDDATAAQLSGAAVGGVSLPNSVGADGDGAGWREPSGSGTATPGLASPPGFSARSGGQRSPADKRASLDATLLVRSPGGGSRAALLSPSDAGPRRASDSMAAAAAQATAGGRGGGVSGGSGSPGPAAMEMPLSPYGGAARSRLPPLPSANSRRQMAALSGSSRALGAAGSSRALTAGDGAALDQDSAGLARRTATSPQTPAGTAAVERARDALMPADGRDKAAGRAAAMSSLR